jgi:orotidine-5'-phosphate decarboxylase
VGNKICLGIDPCISPEICHTSKNQKNSEYIKTFENEVTRHTQILNSYVKENLTTSQQSYHIDKIIRVIKPNLSFFLAHGSFGIQLLEKFIFQMSPFFEILLDAKFSEISNSLKQSLGFAFHELKCNSLTINPFFGKDSIYTCLEFLAKKNPTNEKIYILCQTSESDTNTLAYLQAQPESIIFSALSACYDVFGNYNHVGFVVGAKKVLALENNIAVLKTLNHFSIEPQHLNLLCPGVGAQGVPLEFLSEARKFNCLFPMSRYVFSDRETNQETTLEKINKALNLLPKT